MLSNDEKALEACLSDRLWRLTNLYWITDANAKVVLFKPNAVQMRVLNEPHNRKLILKSRKHGITTLAALLSLDTALFRSNTNCGLVMHKREDAKKVFVQKIMFAYDRLPDPIKELVPIKARDNTGSVEFENGSHIEVSTSHRGGTMQYLHVSEYGPMCSMYPLAAQEVKTGALNAVTPDGIITIESTSYGAVGDFYDMCQRAMKNDALVTNGEATLTSLDYTLLFFPWYDDARNTIDPEGVPLTKENEEYFSKLEAKAGVTLSAGQRAWYSKKKDAEQGEAMLREHPSTPEEAFQAAVEGAYYTKQITRAYQEHRVGRVPFEPGIPVNTYWDLGFADSVAIWFHQLVGLQNRFIRSFQQSGEYLPFYYALLQRYADEYGYTYGTHYLPHDAKQKRLGSADVLTQFQQGMQGQSFEVLPRVDSLWLGIQQTRQAFAVSYFDAVNCADGLTALTAYRKHYDATHQIFTSEPEHDANSHYADAYRQFGQQYATLRLGSRVPTSLETRLRLIQQRARKNKRSAMTQ